jgi:cytochrome oxidase assembly protein ShyY1
VLRTALQPRWLLLLAAVLVVCAGFGWLGSWQLGVAKARGQAEAVTERKNQQVVPIDDVLQPQRSFTAAADGRRVRTVGTYDPSKQVLVSGRVQPGRDGVVGWWVVGALRTERQAWLPVVRGWVRTPDDPAAAATSAPSGTVTVEGVLQPDESPPDVALPDGQLATLDAADLVNRWGTPIYNGFLVATRQQADVPGAGPQPEPVPPPAPQPHGIAWRNAAYAVQWWVFAGFALVMWGKMVQQAARDEAAASTSSGRSTSTREEDEREHTRT